MLISAGFDAHMDDPLAGMRLTSPYFGRLTRPSRTVADECCEGRLVAVTEGGYDLVALAESLRASIRALEGDTKASPPRPAQRRVARRRSRPSPATRQCWKI